MKYKYIFIYVYIYINIYINNYISDLIEISEESWYESSWKRHHSAESWYESSWRRKSFCGVLVRVLLKKDVH